RLQALAAHGDGFRLAEIDLELRREGELIGTRQHGLQQFRVAELPRDAELLERARALAERIAGEDGALTEPEHALLAAALEREYRLAVQAPIPA
ncbi:MAG TPA: ATP-dependent DNA helicase RecG, partial [Solirubrobacteraceae bacterium]|nr:ATP-dependent DNA helicase RecG [Solirubrobacteraceae bacterium]